MSNNPANVDQVLSINQSDKFKGLDIDDLNINDSLNKEENGIGDNFNLDNGNPESNQGYKLNLLDDAPKVEEEEEIKEEIEIEEIDQIAEEEAKKEEKKEEEVQKNKLDEQDKYILKAQMENSNKVKHQREIENEEDLENLVIDETPENDKLVFEGEIRHPRKIIKGKLHKFPSCTAVGCLGCCKSYLNSELDKYGLGMLSYFKTLKSILWSLGIIILLHIIIYLIFIISQTERKAFTINDALFKTTIANIASTLTNCYKISRDNLRTLNFYTINFDCAQYEFIRVNEFGLSAKLNENINNQANCVNFTSSIDLTTDKSCKLQNYINKLINGNCKGKYQCSINVSPYEIFKLCPILNDNDYIYLSYMCHDKLIELGSLSINRQTLSYLIVGLDGGAIIILLITIIILRCDYSKLNKSFKEKNKLINQYTINVKNLGVNFDRIEYEINNLLQHFDLVIRHEMKLEHERKSSLRVHKRTNPKNAIDYIKLNVKNSNENFLNNELNNSDRSEPNYDFKNEFKYPTYVYEVNYPFLSNEKLSLILKREKLLTELILRNSELKKLKREKDFGEEKEVKLEKEKIEENLNQEQNENFDNLNLDNLDNIDNFLAENNFNTEVKVKVNPKSDEENLKKSKPNLKDKYEFQSLNNELKRLKVEIINIVHRIKKNEKADSGKINDILITFLEPKYSRHIVHSYNKNKCTRCCYIFCCNFKKIQHLYYKDSWLEILKNPDNPSNIKWQNMLVSSCAKCVSKSFSIILSIFLILVGFGIIVGSKYFQDILNEEFDNNINCSFVTYTDDSVFTEYFNKIIPKRNRIQTYCFCKNILTSKGFTSTYDYTFPKAIQTYPCKEWIIAFLKFNSITYAITILIPILNALITVFLTMLTHIEKNKSLTSDKSSNMIKIFVGQFINTGLNLLIVNANIPAVRDWNKDFPVFNGSYKDFSSAWFKNVGCTIFFAMIISIFTPHLGNLIEYFIQCIKRSCDSCSSIGKGSKIVDSKVFLQLYVGPELMIDSRYAQVLSVIFVSLLYSSGIPGLYVSMFLTIFLCYWIDKYLFLNFYKIPPKYDLSLSKSFAVSLLFSIVFHLSFAIWIFGNPELITDPSSQNYDFYNLIVKQFNIDVSDETKYSTKILQRFLVTHNLPLSALFTLLVFYITLRFSFLQVLLLIISSAQNSKSVHLITKRKNIINILNDLPLHALYNIYEIRILQIEKLKKKFPNRQCSYYENVYLSNLERERIAIKDRIKELEGQDMTEMTSQEFDDNIRYVMENLNIFDERAIKSDFSYNLAHIDEYRNFAISDYKI